MTDEFYTVGRRFNMVQYNIVYSTTVTEAGHKAESVYVLTKYTSQESYGVPLVRILEKIDWVISAAACILFPGSALLMRRSQTRLPPAQTLVPLWSYLKEKWRKHPMSWW